MKNFAFLTRLNCETKYLLIRSYACQNLGAIRKHCQKHIPSNESEFQKAKF
jgi:hypothetical protein